MKTHMIIIIIIVIIIIVIIIIIIIIIIIFISTHIATANFPDGNSWRLLQVIDLWVQSEIHYPNGLLNVNSSFIVICKVYELPMAKLWAKSMLQ